MLHDLISLSADATPGTDTDVGPWGHEAHVHDFHQFLFTPVGRAVIWTGGRSLRLCPEVGAWIPAGVWHSARFEADSLVLPLAFPAEWSSPVPDGIEVPLDARRQRSVLASLRAGSEPRRELFELLVADSQALPLPAPSSPCAVAVANGLRQAPADQRTAGEWAAALHVGATTLRRAFAAETGLTFSEWRTRLRLNLSVPLLARGLMVSAVAQRVGFTSTNGFILAFRRYFGTTPKAYATTELCA
ncbi:MAG: AraC family transcriptional regulator [Microlunatus sp.]